MIVVYALGFVAAIGLITWGLAWQRMAYWRDRKAQADKRARKADRFSKYNEKGTNL